MSNVSNTFKFPEVNVNVDYVKTMPGLFKCAEIVLSLITFICSVVYPHYRGDGFVDFVTMTAFLTISIDLILCVLSFRSKLPDITNVIMFVVYCVFTLFYFAAFIVCSVHANEHGSIVAAAFFSVICTGIFGVDCFLQFRMWQSGDGAGVSMATTTTTSATTTTSTPAENYSQPSNVTVQY